MLIDVIASEIEIIKNEIEVITVYSYGTLFVLFKILKRMYGGHFKYLGLLKSFEIDNEIIQRDLRGLWHFFDKSAGFWYIFAIF